MKKLKSGKKIFSAIAALAISATVMGGAMSFIGCGDDTATTVDNTSKNRKTVAVDTPLGSVRSRVGNIYYAGPDAQSYGTGDGTLANPFHIGDILSGNIETKLEAGDTLYVLPGEYKLSERIRMLSDNVKGTFNKYIRVVNAALEKEESGYTGTGTQAVLDFSAMEFNSLNRGVEIDTDFIYWYGVDICGAGDNGMYIGGSYNTVEFCEFYNNRDTGLQLGRAEGSYSSIYQWPSYNLVKNCTSHNNYDNQTFGENADGFAAKLTVGFANVFDGCIAYRNSDDGWDLYAKTDSGNIGTVIIYNCVAYENGYLEYTRDECNSLYPKYDKTMPYHTGENSKNDYMTRDGDGNGFKLGGSIMEGDVVLYNCLAYNNRMHGVTDNSNPGYIRSSYVTSYNNSAMVDGNGNIAALQNFEQHSNIDVSRQTYSYNALNYVLSVRDAAAISLDSDNYRGTVKDSLLDALGITNVVKGAMEGDTINNKEQFTEQKDQVIASEMFKKLPNNSGDANTLRGNDDSMVISGGKVTMKDTRAHLALRNADRSINMGDVLAKSDAGKTKYIEGYLGAGKDIGSDLNLTGWSAYTHFYQSDLVNGNAASADMAIAERVREALTINCVEDAVYQDVEVPVRMLDATIKWTTDDTDYIIIKDALDEIDISGSGTEFALVVVQRDPYEDKVVKITATITSGDVSLTRDYYLTLKQGTPSVGNIYVEDADGTVVTNGGKYQYVIDQYKPYREPEIRVQNGLYPDSNKLLRSSEYDVVTTYMYQVNTNTHAVEIRQFTPSVAGVYTVTHRVSLKGSDEVAKMSYKIYVETPNASLDFTGKESNVTVNRNGYTISGAPSKATGILYAVSSPDKLSDVTVNNIKTYSGVVTHTFRNIRISADFANANTGSYYVYYALANADGEIGSQVYNAKVDKVDISSSLDLTKIACGDKVGSEDPSKTIYVLTKDINCGSVTFETKVKNGGFMGVFNGFGHTLSNISVDKGVFLKVVGGTIMNLRVENMTLNTTTGSDKAGFVAECAGGDFYNVAFKNVNVTGDKGRVAALIGQVGDTTKAGGDLTISQVSIVNDSAHKIAGTQRIGGLIGYVQSFGHTISIDNCYVVTDIDANGVGEAGGMVASWEDKADDMLIISQCYYSGQLKTPVSPGSSRLGGMLGYHKGGIGVLKISRCLSLAKIHVQGELREESLKNASPIIGNFSSSSRATVSVRYCIGLLAEYNTEYDVRTFSEINLKRNKLYLTGENYLNLDETRWTIVYAENPEDKRDIYAAPYVTLNFLGNWN